MRTCEGRFATVLSPLIAFLALAFASCLSVPAHAQALLQAGMQAPQFTLKNLEGADTSLSGYAEKKAVVLLFWSTVNGRSQKALKRFEEFHRTYKDKGIQIIGINADNQHLSKRDMEAIGKIVKDLGITFPMLLDDGLKTFHDYNVIALPSTLVVSGGKITYELPGFPLVKTEDMFDYLRVLAGETPRTTMEPKRMPQHDAIANANLAMSYVKRKRSEMAVPLFKKAIDKDPKYVLPYVELAKLYAAEGKNKDAEELLRKALEAEPDNQVVMSELGYLLAKTNRPKEAVDILGKAVKMDSYTPAYYYYAYALALDGAMDKSLEAFAGALSLNPYDPMTYILRGQAYEHQKMSKEASLDYKKALQMLLKVED